MERDGVDVDAASTHDVRERVQRVGQRRCVGIRVHEDEGPPGIHLRGAQCELVAIEVGVGLGARRRAEAAVQPVGPRVVVALEAGAAARAGDHLGAAMAADVGERSQRSVAIAHHDERDIAHAQREIGPGLRELPGVPGVEPAALEQPHALESEHLCVRVPAVGQRLGQTDGA